jgi:hypothetical protein
LRQRCFEAVSVSFFDPTLLNLIPINQPRNFAEDSDPARSAVKVAYRPAGWALDAGCWMLDAGCWMLDATRASFLFRRCQGAGGRI